MKGGLLGSLLLVFFCSNLWAQEDTTETEEEDFSMYADLGYADEAAKRFANAKITGLSPQRLISIGYDYEGPYTIKADNFSDFEAQDGRVLANYGIRAGFNMPVISKNNLTLQLGAQYWNLNYQFENPDALTHPTLRNLSDHGLRTMGVNATVYKPLSEFSFILVQLAADMNGDYAFPDLQAMRYNRYSAAVLWGKRPSDYKQWAIGLSRTYRAGELNYVPILFYNYTSPTSPWGVEALLPARGHVRYRFSSRSIAMLGFELEGNSYRIGNQGIMLPDPYDELEIRRSEIRFRAMYQRQLTGFIWVAAELGYRVNYSFNVDDIPEGQDFTRLFGIVSDAPHVMDNTVTNPVYANISIHLVSP